MVASTDMARQAKEEVNVGVQSNNLGRKKCPCPK